MAYEIKRFPFPGTVDADGHVLEPPDLWENYLEAKYRPRALRIGVDDDGYEYLEIDGKPSARSSRGSLGVLGAMGRRTCGRVLSGAMRTICRSAPATPGSGCHSWIRRTWRSACSTPRCVCCGKRSSPIRT